nr:hypothetical protein [Tanacetum cinerariifolium]
MVNTRTDADLSAAVQTPCRHCFSNSRRDSRGVPYEFWTVGCWWKSPTAFSLTCWFPRSSYWYRGGAGKELSVGSSQQQQLLWNNNRNSGNGRDQRNRGQQSNRSANSGSQ